MSYGQNFENFYNPFPFYVDTDGNPVVGATLTFYASGTNNLLATYSDPDEAAEHQNPNPMTAGANGYFDPIYLQPLPYKVVLAYPDGFSQTRDPVGGMAAIPYPIYSTDSSVKFVASGYGALSTDWGKTLATTIQTATLNLNSGWTNGWNATVKNAYTGAGVPVTTTISTTNGALIDNAATYVLAGQFAAINFVYDGTNFWSRSAINTTTTNRLIKKGLFTTSTTGTATFTISDAAITTATNVIVVQTTTVTQSPPDGAVIAVQNPITTNGQVVFNSATSLTVVGQVYAYYIYG